MEHRRRWIAALATSAAVFATWASPAIVAQGTTASDAAGAAPTAAPSVVMAKRTTRYPGSPPDRNHNMALAAAALDGTVLAPGRALSFNGAIGATTVARGYRYGPVFYGNRVGHGLGGGVCQVASTLYVAARGANLQIVERHPHGLRVAYLPGGEDATVAAGYLDLVIRNDTAGPVRLSAHTRGPAVTVAVIGTAAAPRTWFTHRTLASWPAPVLRVADPTMRPGEERVDAHGSDGLEVHTWFHVAGPDGAASTRDLGVDRYRASPRIIRYGPRAPGGRATE